MLRNLTCLTFAAALLAGCAMPKGEFPSLAKRPYESEDPIAEPVAIPDAVASSLPGDVAASIAALEARHAKADAAFRSMLPSVQAVAARASGAAVGSEAWADANVRLSRLDYARADSVKVVGEIDAMVAAQREADAHSGQPALAPLMERRQRVIAESVERQDAEVNRMGAMLGA